MICPRCGSQSPDGQCVQPACGAVMEQEEADGCLIPAGYYFKDDLDGGRLVKKETP